MIFRSATMLAILAGGLACARPSVPADVPESSGAAASSNAPPSATRPGTPPGARASSAPPQARTIWSPAAPPAVEPAAPLPPVPPADIRFADLAAIRGDLDALRAAGRPVLVNYWATWCGACVQELPLLGELAREWGDGGPAILGVSLDRLTVSDDDPVLEKVRGMLAKHRVSYPNRIARGGQQEVFDAFGIAGGIPVSVLYDGRGAVVRRFTGTVGLDEARAMARTLAPGRGVAGGG